MAHDLGEGQRRATFSGESPFQEWAEVIGAGHRIHEVVEGQASDSIAGAWPVDSSDEDLVAGDEQLVQDPTCHVSSWYNASCMSQPLSYLKLAMNESMFSASSSFGGGQLSKSIPIPPISQSTER